MVCMTKTVSCKSEAWSRAKVERLLQLSLSADVRAVQALSTAEAPKKGESFPSPLSRPPDHSIPPTPLIMTSRHCSRTAGGVGDCTQNHSSLQTILKRDHHVSSCFGLSPPITLLIDSVIVGDPGTGPQIPSGHFANLLRIAGEAYRYLKVPCEPDCLFFNLDFRLSALV